MSGAPCGHCDERQVGCHAECERYQTWATERRAALENDYRKRAVERYERDRRIEITRHHIKRRVRGKKRT